MTAAKATSRPPGERGQGRKPFVPTPSVRHLVVLLRGAGLAAGEVAAELGCSESTLRLHCPDELADGRRRMVGRVARRLIEKALAGDTKACAFILSRLGGREWQATARHELSGPDGTPVQPPNLVIRFHPPITDGEPPLQPLHLKAKAGA